MHPTAFENFAFDMLQLAGLRNAVWRTPGADEGRDIEGEVTQVDISGFARTSKWYVECKRHAKSVDWPTIYGKLAYADSHRADVLLLITTAALTPQCKAQISQWNTTHRTPLLRYWDATTLPSTIERHPQLLAKYGLAPDRRIVPSAFLPLAERCANLVVAAYGDSIFKERENRVIEAAAAVAELLIVRLRDAERGLPALHYPFEAQVDLYEWIVLRPTGADLTRYEKFGLRAILAFFRQVARAGSLTLDAISTNELAIAPPAVELRATTMSALASLSVVADVEVILDNHSLILRPRERP